MDFTLRRLPTTAAGAARAQDRTIRIGVLTDMSGIHRAASGPKAAKAVGGDPAKISGGAAIARMKETPTDDDAFGAGSIRVDGRKIHPVYLFEVKAPNESRGAWDYYKLLQTTAAADAFRPLNEGGCALVRS